MPLKTLFMPAIIIAITLLVASGNTQTDKAGNPTEYFQKTAQRAESLGQTF